jgi:hypothetical protein
LRNIKTVDLKGFSEYGEYIIEDTGSYEAILFITKPDLRIICDGIDFQEFVWGADRYTLWIPCDNVMKCIIGKYFLEKIDNEIILVQRDKINVNIDINEIHKIISEIRRSRSKTCKYMYFFIIPSDTYKVIGNFIFIKTK